MDEQLLAAAFERFRAWEPESRSRERPSIENRSQATVSQPLEGAGSGVSEGTSVTDHPSLASLADPSGSTKVVGPTWSLGEEFTFFQYPAKPARVSETARWLITVRSRSPEQVVARSLECSHSSIQPSPVCIFRLRGPVRM